jgi:predicted lipoprotein with Yx(FWY)xxD motif
MHRPSTILPSHAAFVAMPGALASSRSVAAASVIAIAVAFASCVFVAPAFADGPEGTGATAAKAANAANAATVAPLPPGAPPIRKLEGHLVDLKGRALYTWDGDKVPGQSACTSQCRLLWPPIKADDDAQPKAPFTIATRPDGTRQWALRGRPLYRWASDKSYGDAGGDQVAGSWHLVKVTPTPAAAPAATAGTASPARAATAAGPGASASVGATKPTKSNESKTPHGG